MASKIIPSFILTRWKIIAATFFVVSTLGVYNAVVGERVRDPDQNIFETEGMDTTDLLDSLGEDRYELYFQVAGIDPVREYIDVSYDPVPSGKYGYIYLDSAYLNEDFEVQYQSTGFGRNPLDGIETLIPHKANTWVGGWSAPINLYPCQNIDQSFNEETDRGSVRYPDDSYCFDVLLNTFANVDGEEVGVPGVLVQFGNGLDGYRITFERIPFFLTSRDIACAEGNDCTLSTFIVEGQPGACVGTDECSITADAADGYSRVRGFIERTQVVVLFANIVLITIVLAAVCAVAMTIAVATRIRPPALEGLAFLAGLLFAVQPLRGALPDAPPIGMDRDILVFYPSVLMILLSLVVQVAIWVRRSDYRV